MGIQVEQRALRCRRCGKMLHAQAARIEAKALDGSRVVLCSEICRKEYADIFGLTPTEADEKTP